MAEKIQSLLQDEESMKQLQELAAMFSGGSFDSSGTPEQQGGSPGGNGQPGGSSGSSGNSGGNSGGVNPMAIMQLMNAAQTKDKDSELLLALKPHLSPDKQKRVDKAVKMLRLYNIFVTMRDSGMLNDLEKML